MPSDELPREYVDYLKKTLSQLEKLGDNLSGSDERLDYAVQQLANVQAKLKELPVIIENLGGLVNIFKEYLTMPKRTEQIILRQNLAPLQGVRIQDVIPIDGKLTSVAFHFPPGCLALVSIAFGYKTRQIMPSAGFLVLDDATPVFPCDEVVKRNEPAWAIMQNADAVNPHDVSVIVTMSGEEA